ncbi:hypothetical protein [Azonexus sp. IMCC34839]|uniref:hypothetical protein n=1 Tax=Azonexus sp. IMCC34839 TaxID=3133695 RepID=UPI0039998CAB
MTPERELELLAAIALKDEAIGAFANRFPESEIAREAIAIQPDSTALSQYAKRIADAVEKLVVERCANECSSYVDFPGAQNGVAKCAAAIRALPLGQIDIEKDLRSLLCNSSRHVEFDAEALSKMSLEDRLIDAFENRVCGTAMLSASDLLSAITRIEQLTKQRDELLSLLKSASAVIGHPDDEFSQLLNTTIAGAKDWKT